MTNMKQDKKIFNFKEIKESLSNPTINDLDDNCDYFFDKEIDSD